MAVPQFPQPSNYTTVGGEPIGPICLKLRPLQPERPGVIFKQMVDGGGTYGADTTNKILRWELTYDGLTDVQAKVLDDHNDAAIDTLLGFIWREPRSGTAYSSTHYESYERDHSKYFQTQSRKIVLVNRPV